MPIKYETILSIYDDKLTLLQYLKKVEKALQDDGADFDELVITLATKTELTSAVEGLQTDIRHAEDRADEALSEAKIYTDEKIAELPTESGTKFYKHTIIFTISNVRQQIILVNKRSTAYTELWQCLEDIAESVVAIFYKDELMKCKILGYEGSYDMFWYFNVGQITGQETYSHVFVSASVVDF